jgi:NAD-reducing hydrogenase small subunit
LVVSFGDCAVTGNVTSLRNRLDVNDLLNQVYQNGPGQVPRGNDADHVLPALLPKVLPLHQVIAVDAFITGCPPDPDRIWASVMALVKGETLQQTPDMRRFG